MPEVIVRDEPNVRRARAPDGAETLARRRAGHRRPRGAVPVNDGRAPVARAGGPYVVGTASPHLVESRGRAARDRRPSRGRVVQHGPRRAERPDVVGPAAPEAGGAGRAAGRGRPGRSVPVPGRGCAGHPDVAGATDPHGAQRRRRARRHPIPAAPRPVLDDAAVTDGPDVVRAAARDRVEVVEGVARRCRPRLAVPVVDHAVAHRPDVARTRAPDRGHLLAVRNRVRPAPALRAQPARRRTRRVRDEGSALPERRWGCLDGFYARRRCARLPRPTRRRPAWPRQRRLARPRPRRSKTCRSKTCRSKTCPSTEPRAGHPRRERRPARPRSRGRPARRPRHQRRPRRRRPAPRACRSRPRHATPSPPCQRRRRAPAASHRRSSTPHRRAPTQP